MRFALTFGLFVWLSGFAATAQVLPTSTGSCGVSPSGVQSCDWLSAITLHRGDRNEATKTVVEERPKLFITRFVLSRGAPLQPPVAGQDVLIVGMNDGELVNEATSPPTHITVWNGLVMLMAKEEPFLLRNVGTQNLDLLLIEIRNITP